MIKLVPKLLILLRLVIALVIFFVDSSSSPSTTIPIITLIYTGILSDALDGIIARKLNVATTSLRVYDTIVDLIFYLSAFYFAFELDGQMFKTNYILICIILALETSMYVISIFRFGRLPSPHAILSKFWGIYLVIELTLLVFQVQGMHFFISLCIGLVVHMDRLLIYSFIKKWEHDIPSCLHALWLRQGKEIVRNSLFN